MERALKKRLYLYIGILFASMIAVVIVITVYYEYKFRNMITSLYGMNAQAGKELLYILFYGSHGSISVSDYSNVLQDAGYTKNGAWYMFLYGGGYIPFLIVGAIIIVMGVIALYNIVKIGHNDIYSYAKEQKELNENLSKELKTYKSYMEKRNRQLQDFTENIAHQIKTPLTALSLSLDMMEEGLISDSTSNMDESIKDSLSKNLHECFRQTYRIKDFILRLLKLSRMESGKIIFTNDDINVKEFMKEVINEIPVEGKDNIDKDCGSNGDIIKDDSSKNNNRHCIITMDCDSDDYCINADHEWLLEAMINIVQNCTEEAEHVNMSAVCNDDKCIITIKDDGKGIDKDKIENVFNRFESGKSYSSMHTGIGLNLSKLIIEAHKGSVSVNNNEDSKGVSFRIIIPRYDMKRKA